MPSRLSPNSNPDDDRDDIHPDVARHENAFTVARGSRGDPDPQAIATELRVLADKLETGDATLVNHAHERVGLAQSAENDRVLHTLFATVSEKVRAVRGVPDDAESGDETESDE